MELLLLLTFCGLFVGVPAIIYKSAKTLTIKENENYSRLKETLEKQQVDRVWEAFKRSGVVPLPSGFAGIENVSLFNDQNQSLIFAFQFENHLARKESRIPKTYKKLEENATTADEAGLEGTPTFYVNGKKISNMLLIPVLNKIVNDLN